MKYEFSIMALDTLDPITKLFFEIQNATGLYTYFLILLVSAASLFVFIRKTQDIGASAVKTMHIMFTTTVLLYFWGVEGGYSAITGGKEFISVIFLFIVVIAYIVLLIGLKFYRSNQQ